MAPPFIPSVRRYSTMQRSALTHDMTNVRDNATRLRKKARFRIELEQTPERSAMLLAHWYEDFVGHYTHGVLAAYHHIPFEVDFQPCQTETDENRSRLTLYLPTVQRTPFMTLEAWEVSSFTVPTELYSWSQTKRFWNEYADSLAAVSPEKRRSTQVQDWVEPTLLYAFIRTLSSAANLSYGKLIAELYPNGMPGKAYEGEFYTAKFGVGESSLAMSATFDFHALVHAVNTDMRAPLHGVRHE